MNNIAITIDDHYVQHACVMLQSLHITNPQPINIYCIYLELSDANRQLLIKHFRCTHLNLSFIPLRGIPDLPIRPGDHVSIATFFRIWIPDILTDLDEVLFLDSDIIIDGDISYLLDLDVRQCPLAAAKDPAMPPEKKQKLQIPPHRDYFNAGVLKLNLAWFRKHRLTEQLLAFIRHFPELCEFWDQDALNAVLKGNFYRIDYKYNMQTSLFDDRLLQHPSFTDKLEKPVVIHFTGGGNCKPWLYLNHHPLKKLYYQALHSTPFSNYLPPDMPLHRKLIARILSFIRPSVHNSITHC